MSYQPKYIPGEPPGPSTRDVEQRYDNIVEQMNSKSTVLDFGAFGGYFSHRLADEILCECTAVDDAPELTDDYGITVVRERLNPKGIRDLGHFDYGLCLSVLHHLPHWKRYLDALVETCDVLFVETSNPAEVLPEAAAQHRAQDIEDAVKALGASELTRTPGWDSRYMRPLWRIG